MKKSIFFILTLFLFSTICFSITLNVKDFGAVGDGKTDDTNAFNTAMAEAHKAGGGIVNAPTGQYCIKGNLSIPHSVTLQGESSSAPLYYASDGIMMGSTLLAYAGKGDPNATPFITLEGHMSSIRGFCIYYPEWSQAIVPPTPYPPCIYGKPGDNISIENMTLQNPYDGIVFNQAGRFYINNVQGYPIHKGIVIDKCFDVGRIENVHFWPFGVVYKVGDPYCEWINNNATAFEFNRTDWQYVTNTFCFGYAIGYHLKGSQDGSSNGSMLCVGSDCTVRGVVVEEIQPMGWAITNGEFVGKWGSTNSIGIDITGNRPCGKINVSNSSFWGPLVSCVRCDNPTATLTLNGNTFSDWDLNNDQSPAINLLRGRAIITDNTFVEKSLDIFVNKDMGSSIISSNLSVGGLKVQNLSKNFIQIKDNEPIPEALSKKEKENYIVKSGYSGDLKYIFKTFAPEPASNPLGENDPTLTDYQRWTTEGTYFMLPTTKGKKYHLTFNIFVPSYSLAEQNGFYYGDKCIGNFNQPGTLKIEADITAKDDISKITLKCKTWKPKDNIEGNPDSRDLGILIRNIEVKMIGTKEPQTLAR